MAQVRYNGRAQYEYADTLQTYPLAGLWSAGDVRLFDGPYAEQHGRACHQLNGRPCGKGSACDCWAELFVAEWNLALDRRNRQTPAPFEIVTPAPAPTSPKRAATRRGK